MSDMNDFVIENGVLKRYVGPGGDVVIPGGVTSIGQAVFKWSKKLKSVTIPDSVTSIGVSAFINCRDLTNVMIPGSVTSIGDSAFYHCSSLTSVTIPDGVTSIGDFAFSECESLANVTIGNGVKSIGQAVFKLCKKLKSVTIPDGVTHIGDSAFSWCSRLTGLSVDENNPNYVSDKFGCLYNKSKTTLIQYPIGNRRTSFTIPDSVTSIGDHAFWGCHNLTSVTIPNSVTNIGNDAFSCCNSLTSVTIPDSVTSIEGNTFYDCSSLTSVMIPNSVTKIANSAFSGCSSLTSVKIPESVTSIANSAFSGCGSLTSVTIPDSITSIGDAAFYNCSSLTSVMIPNSVTSIGHHAFFECSSLSSVMIPDSVTSIGIYAFFDCNSLISVTIPYSLAISLSACFVYHNVSLFVAENGRFHLYAYSENVNGSNLQDFISSNNWAAYDLELINNGPRYKYKLSVRLLGALGRLMEPTALDEEHCILFEELLSKNIKKVIAFAEEIKHPELVRALFDLGLINKENEKTIKKLLNVSSDPSIAELSTMECKEKTETKKTESDLKERNSAVEEKVQDILSSEKRSIKELETSLKSFYGVEAKLLPELKDVNGHTVKPFVGAWLLTAHESIERNYSYSDIVPAFEAPGLRKEAAEVIDLLDSASLQNMLLSLADANLGIVGRSKKMFLAYPICRYADEATMAELTKRAPKWRSSVSGNDAPPLLTFRAAVLYNNTRAAMLFADRFDDLGAYAELRGEDEDTLRDRCLSDVGLDEHRAKTYDLGNQVVTARLQKDFTFLFELPNGKTAKSLPKRGADEEKYAAAKADFDEIKKSVKKIIKNRFDRLFEDFLSGRKRDAAGWQASYLHNPLLRDAASLLIWKQGEKTFTLTDDGAINSAGRPYTFSGKPITVAHPMNMKADHLAAWQKYFTSHGLKQPFAQVWEPVHKAEDIKPDRYKDCVIPYYRFTGQKKHGIEVYDESFHTWITICFKDCDAKVERIDVWKHMLYPDDRFEVQKFSFKKYTRQVNHIVSYLDRITVWDRVRKDDLTVGDMLDNFTFAQIMEFISAAQEANATNVLALLLEYKNKTFSDFDPMDEFTLDW